MNAIEDNASSRGWQEIAQRFPKPRAIVCISAHWVSDGVKVMSNARPPTIHDFGRSFPQALFDVQYPAPGDPALAQRIVEMLKPFDAQLDGSWGLDHGTWSVLKHMYPEADVAVVQLSLDIRRPPAEHYEIGRALAALRDDNILLLGSGNIVHNLPAFFRATSPEPQPWVAAYDNLIVASVEGDHSAALTYKSQPDAAIAAPDWEHYMPVVYALGAQRPGETPYVFNRYYDPGLSMTAFAYGLPQ
jgi:4,5-DOPA dioxygenase extradiol